eukprot:GILK01002509.1.p1 GENE.GILK01002509.1~~GILK01002509.1.p1  ORF type:complete len:242 (-),score=39.16 GILK01002509.1:189-914(-)
MAGRGKRTRTEALVLTTPEMASYCFEVLLSHLNRTPEPPFPSAFPTSEYPLFVTWLKTNRADDEPSLRGCIGTFSALPLTGLKEYALTSALRDRRFSPITAREVPFLHCGVSLLTCFEDGADAYDWEIGTHGILIDFTTRDGGSYHATYLPEVAAEQGWTQDEALHSLIKKAGYNGHIDKHLFGRIKLTRYQSSKVTISYAQHLEIVSLRSSLRSMAAVSRVTLDEEEEEAELSHKIVVKA